MKFIFKICNFVAKCTQRNNFSASAITSAQNQSGPDSIMNVFDRRCKVAQRNRAILAHDSDTYDYIRDEVGYRVADRVYDIKRRFDIMVDLGCGKGSIGKHLSSDVVGIFYFCDSSATVLNRVNTSIDLPSSALMIDEEFLPFKNDSVDIVVSCLSLHWVNNLPGTFRQIYNALKSDGVFLAAIFGGDTLYELRCSLQLAEIEREGGFSAHISPFTSVQDIGSLLNRAGFTMLTVDVDEIIINYPSMMEVMWDIQGMGESNSAWNRKSHLHRQTILAGSSIYKERYGNADGTVPATFQIMYLIGWKPDSSQPKPAQRGSANVSLKDLSNIDKVLQKKIHEEVTNKDTR